MNTLEGTKTKIDRVARTIRPILADSKGSLPKTMEVLKAGVWRTPYHGDFMITVDDLNQYVENFNAGIGLVAAGIGAPIDFSHDNHKEAAGWIKELYVEEDSLMAKVEWSTAGKEALLGGLYKCFSPEFFPKGRGGWCDPEDYEHCVDNVLVGGGLTNIPLFKGLSPVMASASADTNQERQQDRNVIFIKASENKETNMTLEEIRGKDVAALTEEEKTFLAEHKSELTTEEQSKFGMEVTPAAEVVPTPAEEPAAVTPEAAVVTEEPKVEEPAADLMPAAVAASIKSGESVVIKASELTALRDTAAEYRKEKAQNIVKAHAARGAIKADQVEAWADRVSKDSSVEDLLKALPDNPVLASEQGSSTKAGETTGSAWSKIEASAEKIVADSNGATNFNDAVKQVTRENPELAKQYEEERNS